MKILARWNTAETNAVVGGYAAGVRLYFIRTHSNKRSTPTAEKIIPETDKKYWARARIAR